MRAKALALKSYAAVIDSAQQTTQLANCSESIKQKRTGLNGGTNPGFKCPSGLYLTVVLVDAAFFGARFVLAALLRFVVCVAGFFGTRFGLSLAN